MVKMRIWMHSCQKPLKAPESWLRPFLEWNSKNCGSVQGRLRFSVLLVQFAVLWSASGAELRILHRKRDRQLSSLPQLRQNSSHQRRICVPHLRGPLCAPALRPSGAGALWGTSVHAPAQSTHPPCRCVHLLPSE